MTRIPGLDAYLTKDGPEHTCDPHAPFTVHPAYNAIIHTPDKRTRIIIRQPGVCVYDDRHEDAPAVLVLRGEPTLRGSEEDADRARLWPLAARYAIARNREAPPPNEDGPGGSCTVCGDFHGEPHE
jgi:hypothetical protein